MMLHGQPPVSRKYRTGSGARVLIGFCWNILHEWVALCLADRTQQKLKGRHSEGRGVRSFHSSMKGAPPLRLKSQHRNGNHHDSWGCLRWRKPEMEGVHVDFRRDHQKTTLKQASCVCVCFPK